MQVAKRLGAGGVVGAGRDAERLSALNDLGADATACLDNAAAVSDLAEAVSDVDVVIDYLWGPITAEVMAGIAGKRVDPGKPLTWIEIGSVAGASARIPSAAVRAVRLQIIGSGQGSVSTRDILAEIPVLVDEITSGTFYIGARTVPLADVETAWSDTATDQRIVITP